VASILLLAIDTLKSLYSSGAGSPQLQTGNRRSESPAGLIRPMLLIRRSLLGQHSSALTQEFVQTSFATSCGRFNGLDVLIRRNGTGVISNKCIEVLRNMWAEHGRDLPAIHRDLQHVAKILTA
jgi:hypothetical protein